ncbi:MAG TPA: tetratricopeptide repeat protein [Actinoallomurus sp.]|jgi:tetratricopeptide (TPR) repeat protein
MFTVPESAAKTLVNKGALRLAAGDLDSAETLLREAITVDPLNATAHVNLGFALACRGDHESAIAEAEEALAIEPGRSAPWAHLGMSLLALGRVDDGLTALGRAVRLDAGNHFAWNALGRVYLIQGRLAEAEAAWSAAVEAAPNDVDLLVSWAAALAGLDRAGAAARVLQRATEADPASVRAWTQLGVIALVRHDYGSAGDALLQALDLDPDCEEARFHLALLHVLMGAVDEARAGLERIAAAQGPWSPEAAGVLARIDRSAGPGGGPAG